ncbi:syringactin [Pseudomonas syringae]|uniref:syringactin n=1 Tax=Pseudomonas syringae TaxID=317 RepID=UPI001F0E91FC|nr:syringactin [Pseudomonas syringae]MCH5521179.1 syringactin [Pseudomonas syringae pv. lapsa]
MDSKVIVMDISPATIQAGWRGEAVPSVDLPVPEKLFNGQGEVVEWGAVSALLDTVLLDKFKWSDNDEVTIMYVVPSLMPKAGKEKLLQLSFDDDKYRLKGVFLKSAASAILFSLDRTKTTLEGETVPNVTGVAIRTDKKTAIITVDPVFQGVLLPSAALKLTKNNWEGSFDPQFALSDDSINILADTIVLAVQRTNVDVRSLLYKNLVLSGSRVNESGFMRSLKRVLLKKRPREH